MSTKNGTYLGAVRCLQTLRLRCVVEPGCDCWHLHKSDGRPIGLREKPVVFVHGVGALTGPRAAYLLTHGRLPISGLEVFRACESHDCVNPDHIRAGTRKTKAAARIAVGQFATPARRRHWQDLRDNAPRIVTAELQTWIAESQQTGPEVAHGLGVTKQTVNRFRKRMRRAPNSVFSLAVGLRA